MDNISIIINIRGSGQAHGWTKKGVRNKRT